MISQQIRQREGQIYRTLLVQLCDLGAQLVFILRKSGRTANLSSYIKVVNLFLFCFSLKLLQK